jgi:hypothetical protein
MILKRTKLVVGQHYIRSDLNLLYSNRMSGRRYIQMGKAKEMAVKRDVCILPQRIQGKVRQKIGYSTLELDQPNRARPSL